MRSGFDVAAHALNGLDMLATDQERVSALLDVGLSADVIARATGVTAGTVRAWLAGQSRPRAQAALMLDDLRATVRILLDGGLSGAQAVAWLTSRDGTTGVRPFELLGTHPMSALAAAAAVAQGLAGPLLTMPAEPQRPAERRSNSIVDVAGVPVAQTTDRQPTFSLSTLLGPDGRPVEPGGIQFRRLELAQRRVSEELLARLRSHPEEMRKLHWRKFEELIADLFERDGYAVELTPARGDRGVDLFAARHTRDGQMLYVVQCKRHTAQIGPSFVRELAWVIERHRASRGILTATSYYTPGAVAEQQTIPYRLTLADLNDLRRWLGGGPISLD